LGGGAPCKEKLRRKRPKNGSKLADEKRNPKRTNMLSPPLNEGSGPRFHEEGLMSEN